MSWPCHSLSCYRTSVLPWMSERHWKLHCQPWTPTMPVSLKHFFTWRFIFLGKGYSDPVPKINTASLVRGCKVATFSVHKVIENTVLHYRWKKPLLFAVFRNWMLTLPGQCPFWVYHRQLHNCMQHWKNPHIHSLEIWLCWLLAWWCCFTEVGILY